MADDDGYQFCDMLSVADWIMERYKFDPNKLLPPKFLVMHPDEIRRIEEKYGSVDSWWRENTGGRQADE
jgi:hypothetical protein